MSNDVNQDDEKIGARTRDLLRAFSDFTNMLLINAPTPVLARQLDELEKIAAEIDSMARSGLFDSDVFSTLGDAGKLMRIYELLQYRQAQKPASE